MTKRRITVAIVIAGAAVGLWAARPAPGTPAVAAAGAADAGQLGGVETGEGDARADARIARLERRLAMLELERAEEPSMEHADGIDDAEPATPVPSREELEALARERDEREEASLVERLDGEMGDRGWASELGERMHRLMDEAELAGTEIRGVRCGQSVCRVELSHDSFADHEPFVHAMMNGLAGYDGWMRPDPEDGQSSRLYLQKTERTGATARL